MDALRRPAVLEDAVTYRLFLVLPDPSEEQKREQTLQAMVQEILPEVAPLLVQYIWQNQPFSLKYYPEKGNATPLKLHTGFPPSYLSKSVH